MHNCRCVFLNFSEKSAVFLNLYKGSYTIKKLNLYSGEVTTLKVYRSIQGEPIKYVEDKGGEYLYYYKNCSVYRYDIIKRRDEIINEDNICLTMSKQNTVSKDECMYNVFQDPIKGWIVRCYSLLNNKTKVIYREIEDDWAEIESVSLNAEERNIKCVRYKGKYNTNCIIYLHGGPRMTYTGRYNELFRRFCTKLKIDIYWIEYYEREDGYDDYDKTLIERTISDVILLRRNMNEYKKIILFGESFGGYIAYQIWIRTVKLWQGCIIGAGFSSMRKLMEHGTEKVRRVLMKYYDASIDKNIGLTDESTGRLVIIHGDKDERIPVIIARWLYEEVTAKGLDVDYYELEGQPHEYVFYLDQFRFENAVFDAVERIINNL